MLNSGTLIVTRYVIFLNCIFIVGSVRQGGNSDFDIYKEVEKYEKIIIER